jgi:hypothetical protein
MVDSEGPTDEGTLEAERLDAGEAHVADRAPTPDEEAAAEKAAKDLEGDSKETAAHYEEMSDLGAHAKGEGAID